MPLIKLVDKEEAPPAVREVYEMGEKVYGRVLYTWQAIAHNPEAFKTYLPYVRAVFTTGVLDVRIKELTAVRVGLLNHCRYTVCHRVNSSRNNGIPDEDLLGLLDPDNHDFTDAERAALAFADELTTNMTSVSYADNRQGVSADTLVRLKAHYSDAEISELTLSVSLWNALTRFHRVMDFELDMPEPLAEMITDL